jgi:tellurite resistance protein
MTTEQQQLFLSAALTIAEADEHLDLDERTFIERVRREIGGATPEPQVISHGDLLEQTRNAFGGALVAARAFLIELAGLVVADGHHSDAELTLLHDVAEAAGVASADVPLFLDFAQRAVELADDARDLLATSNVDQS